MMRGQAPQIFFPRTATGYRNSLINRLSFWPTVKYIIMPLFYWITNSNYLHTSISQSNINISNNKTASVRIKRKVYLVQKITCIYSQPLDCSQLLQWSINQTLLSACLKIEKKIDALDNWCLRRILHINWTDFVSNDVVLSRTGQPLPSDRLRQRRLSFFGHLCHADTGQDHSRALRACIRGPPKDWRQKNWKTEANLAENGWGWSAPSQLRPGDGKTARYG